MSNSLQQAYRLSQAEYKAPKVDRVAEAIAAGKWVVGIEDLVHCKFTDAVIASESILLSVHDTEAEAQAEYDIEACCSEYFIAGPKPEPVDMVAYEVDKANCPF